MPTRRPYAWAIRWGRSALWTSSAWTPRWRLPKSCARSLGRAIGLRICCASWSLRVFTASRTAKGFIFGKKEKRQASIPPSHATAEASFNIIGPTVFYIDCRLRQLLHRFEYPTSCCRVAQFTSLSDVILSALSRPRTFGTLGKGEGNGHG